MRNPLPKRIFITPEIAIDGRKKATYLESLRHEVKDGWLTEKKAALPAIKEAMRGKHVMFDIGAGIGYWSLIAYQERVGFIVAFESDPEDNEVLQEAIDRYNASMAIVSDPKPNLDQFVDDYAMVPDLLFVNLENIEVLETAIGVLSGYKPEIILNGKDLIPEFLEIIGYQEYRESIDDVHFLRVPQPKAEPLAQP